MSQPAVHVPVNESFKVLYLSINDDPKNWNAFGLDAQRAKAVGLSLEQLRMCLLRLALPHLHTLSDHDNLMKSQNSCESSYFD